ncbi:MAG: MBG domain-containing protein, partial [Lachnospiraceae bacterium]|nr:MBG domain-containing protein [Lachnospiraceae bacterium]
KALTLTVDNNSKTYGDADPALTAVTTDLVGSDTLDYTILRDQGENAGDYGITATFAADANPDYDVTVVDGTFTISPKEVDVTIVANNQTKTYGEADPELSAQINGMVGEDELNYTLTRESGEDAGTYDIYVTLGENPNYVVAKTEGTFTITKKDVTVAANDNSKIYGEADPELTATITGVEPDDTLDYTVVRTEGEHAGDYVITVVPGSNSNYNITTEPGTFAITKKTVTVSLGNSNKIYGEADPDLAPTITGLEDGDTLDYTIIRTPGEHAGEYTVSVVLGSNPDYDVTVEDGTLTIEKKALTLIVDNNSKTYGDTDPVLTAVTTDLVGSDTLDYTILRDSGEDAGDYGITATFAADANPDYDVTVVDGTFTISPKEVDVTIVANNQTKTYGEADPELSAQVKGMVGEDELNYTLTREPGEDAGTYDIYVTLGENPNYIVAKTEGTFTITKKDITVAANDNNKIYGEADPELTATATGVVGTDNLDFTLSRDPGENAGTYVISVVPGSNSNYNIILTEGQFTINKKSLDVTVAATDKTKVYGDADPELTAIVSGLVGDDTMNFTLSREAGENAGIYPIHVTLGENPNYEAATTDATFTIVKKVIGVQVLAQNGNKTYGEKDPVLKAAVLGLKTGDTLNYTLSRLEGEHAGTYAMHVTVGENANYDVETVEDATFTILPKAITLTATNSSKIAGTTDPALAATITGLIGTDILNYSVNRIAGEIAGTYVIRVAYSVNSDYAVTVVEGLFTILPGPITPVIPVPTPTPAVKTPVVTVTDEAVPLTNIDTESKGYQLTEVPDEKVPLAKVDLNEHKCCILHFLIMLLAFVVELCYTRSMKRRQARIFELREKIKLDNSPNN